MTPISMLDYRASLSGGGMEQETPAPDFMPHRRPDSYVPPSPGIRTTRLLAAARDNVRAHAEEQGVMFADVEAPEPPKKAPPTLFLAGEGALLDRKGVAIVGTRAASSEGAKRARRLARELVEAGVVIVSGLAKGIDTEALQAALEAGGRVIAVIGTPLDKAYPAQNKRLQELIYREHLLISPFADGTVVHKHHFPVRNRVMAALSSATVIVEASDTSGTLHQAAECTKIGRWLFIAKSVIEDPKLSWPKKFTKYDTTRTLTATGDVLSVIGR